MRSGRLTRSQLLSLTNISAQLEKFQYGNIEYAIAKRLNDAIPHIGRITITSTFRKPGQAGSATRSYHLTGRAIDFVVREKPLWIVYLTLRNLGFRRIGLRPDANMIHVDSGNGSYFFVEGTSGQDQGPLSRQPATRLASIPGYTDTPASVSAAAITGSSGGTLSTKEKFIAGIFIASLILSKILWR